MSIFQKILHKNKKQDLNKDELYLALDIGTEVVKGLLFKISDIGVEIISTSYLRQPLKAMQAGRVLDTDLVVKTSNQVIDALFKNINMVRKPNITTIFGIAGELINGISVSANINRLQRADAIIDENEEENILNTLFEQIVGQGKQELADTLGIPKEQVLVLNVSVNGMYVDGRPVVSLKGQSGARISAFLYASFAPVSIVQTLSNIVKELRVKLAGIVVQPYAVARSFVSRVDSDFSGIFIDIGGGTTDVALVLEGFNIQTQMFAFGGRAFTQRLANKFNLSYEMAEQRKIKYSAGALPADLARQVREVLREDVKLWLDTVKVALQKMEGVQKFPSMIYLCGGGAMLPDIQDTIMTYPWAKFLPFEKHPKVALTTPQKQDKVYDKTGKLVYPYDVTPVALARYLYDIITNKKYNYVGFEYES